MKLINCFKIQHYITVQVSPVCKELNLESCKNFFLYIHRRVKLPYSYHLAVFLIAFEYSYFLLCNNQHSALMPYIEKLIKTEDLHKVRFEKKIALIVPVVL